MTQSVNDSSNTQLRGAIFDLDGTLADTLRDITDAVNRALARVHLPPANLDDVRLWIGDGLSALCRRAWPEASEAQLDRFVQLARCEYGQGLLVRTRLYPGVTDLLNRLQAAGVRLAILSNKPHELTLQTVQGLGVAGSFDAVRGYQTEEEKKPSPRAALSIAEAWNLPPSKVVFIGDSAIDVATARAAGMTSVAVTWGFRTRSELADLHADYLVDRPADVAALFNFNAHGPARTRPAH